ncbi:ParA family protein [Nitrosomonas ureae]|uniref:Chromosome partitioning protein n=1 Tax=Nitrosomonas ureae TaxID=44577 RepID=A0A1H9GII2_9PROT|nr:ParA family protein [Nitrosomonas ureae]SDU23148.1 chromosome partitioning protein [Nitrosomonas ureae]SEQ49892.1 chromosome partitioning protein [Nitrosomonas ureae]
MPTIVFASSKGGAGKTTAAIVLASELAQHNTSVTLIDADPNQHSAKWALKDGCPSNIKLVEKSTEETIIDDIDNAQEQTAFVLVDLEGTASMAVASAISRADLVITLCQGSQDDADEAAKTIKLVNRQAKVLNRSIPFAVLMTRTNPAITPRTLKHIMNEFRDAGVDIFKTSLIDREAFRAIRSFGGTVNDLDPKQVSGIDKATANAHALAVEVIERIKGIKRERGQNHD